MKRAASAGLALCLSALSLGQDPIRAYVAADGSVRLWLRQAPSVVAEDQGTWNLTPATVRTNAAWLKRLKQLYPSATDPWERTLDDLQAGTNLTGIERVEPAGKLMVAAPKDGRVLLTATSRNDRVEVPFRQEGAAWSSGMRDRLDAWLGRLTTGMTVSKALGRYAAKTVATTDDGWSAFIDANPPGATARPLVLEGVPPVVVEVVPPPRPPTQVRTVESPKEPTATVAKPEEPNPAALAAAVGVGGLLLGFAAGYGMRKPRPEVEKPAQAPDNRLADALRELDRLTADLARATAALNESNRAAKQYRDEHRDWLRDRNETLKALDEERSAHAKFAQQSSEVAGLLKASEDAKNRLEAEMAKQLQAAKSKIQSQEARAGALAQRVKAYAALHQESMEAFNFLQGEIGRPEIAAVVGYLLNYSIANLMDTLLAPNPNLERAMLSNIARIANSVSSLPHVRKVARTAEALQGDVSGLPLQESSYTHAYAGHMGGLLRLLRNHLNVEVAPFYIGVDEAGDAYAVYI